MFIESKSAAVCQAANEGGDTMGTSESEILGLLWLSCGAKC
jgi:hypothetical protein